MVIVSSKSIREYAQIIEYISALFVTNIILDMKALIQKHEETIYDASQNVLITLKYKKFLGITYSVEEFITGDQSRIELFLQGTPQLQKIGFDIPDEEQKKE